MNTVPFPPHCQGSIQVTAFFPKCVAVFQGNPGLIRYHVQLVIADGNFPVESMGKNAITIRCDGHGVPEILDAILKLFPLDTYVEHPVNLMEVMPGDTVETPIWDTYKEIIAKHDERGDKAVGNIERFAFYDEAKTAYCIISTGEKALYANIMLQKGVVIND